jgi:formate-dependent nitrite reductase membrane component NrfD
VAAAHVLPVGKAVADPASDQQTKKRAMVKTLSYLVETVCVYCTDFMINLANLTGLSYYEVNALLFLFIWPTLTAGLSLLLIVQKVRLNQTRKARQHSSGMLRKICHRANS